MMDMEINANVLELAVHRTSPHSLSPLGQATCAERSRRKKPGDIIYIYPSIVARSWSLVKLQHLQAERMFGKIGGSK